MATKQLGYRVDAEIKDRFHSLCEEQDKNPNKVIERLMNEYIKENEEDAIKNK